jgi:chemotaxis protein MotB
MLVYPRLEVPKRESDPVVNRPSGPLGPGRDKGRRNKVIFGASVAGALILGFLVRPLLSSNSQVNELEAKLAEADKATASARTHGTELQTDLDKAVKQRDDAQAKLKDAETEKAELAGKVADADKKVKEVEGVEAKLRATIDKDQGSVTTVGDEIHLKLVDHILFKTGDDQLTDSGKSVLGKVAGALREFPDKQIWVQGHTDDQPIFVPPPPKPAKPTKPPAKPVAPPPVKFVTNWELSAARALQVVHYLQDTSKIEPTRLAAVAFGQYHPVSRTDRAQNRRIEIVLYPKRVVAK